VAAYNHEHNDNKKKLEIHFSISRELTKAAAFQSKSTQVNGQIIAHNMKAMFPSNPI